MTRPDRRGRSKASWLPRCAAAGAAAALAASALAGCSDSGGDPKGVNDADVTYASSVVVHHAQSVQLLNLRPDQGDAGAAMGMWVDTARTHRLRELRASERLLRSWDRKVPETGLQHSDEGKHIEFDSDVLGVLTHAQVRAIERETGSAFTHAWLNGLIDHELGAVRLAEAEMADGQNAETVAIAEKDRAAHAAQVDRLRRMLES